MTYICTHTAVKFSACCCVCVVTLIIYHASFSHDEGWTLHLPDLWGQHPSGWSLRVHPTCPLHKSSGLRPYEVYRVQESCYPCPPPPRGQKVGRIRATPSSMAQFAEAGLLQRLARQLGGPHAGGLSGLGRCVPPLPSLVQFLQDRQTTQRMSEGFPESSHQQAGSSTAGDDTSNTAQSHLEAQDESQEIPGAVKSGAGAPLGDALVSPMGASVEPLAAPPPLNVHSLVEEGGEGDSPSDPCSSSSPLAHTQATSGSAQSKDMQVGAAHGLFYCYVAARSAVV